MENPQRILQKSMTTAGCFRTVRSRTFKSQQLKVKGSNPKVSVCPNLKLSFQSSKLPGAGPIFWIKLSKTGRSPCPRKTGALADMIAESYFNVEDKQHKHGCKLDRAFTTGRIRGRKMAHKIRLLI